MIEIDGGAGEGGGQIVRSSVALSLLTGEAVRLVNIRAGRAKPGLQPQHLTSVLATAAVGRAEVEGATLRSQSLTFAPGEPAAGDYTFDVGTAGSVGLVLHTVYLPLALARSGEGSRVALVGGTHVPASPSHPFNAATWAGWLGRLGLPVEIAMERPGFYPRGGGKITASIPRIAGLKALNMLEWPAPMRVRGVVGVAGLPDHIAERLAARSEAKLGAAGLSAAMECQRWTGGPGCAVALTVVDACVPTTFVGIGERGKPAEEVANAAVADLVAFVRAGAPVDPHSADQLILPLAFASGPSTFRVSAVTRHLQTNMEVVGRFSSRRFECKGELGAPGIVTIGE